VPDTAAGIPDFDGTEIYQPTTYLEDVKNIVFLKTVEGRYRAVARESPDREKIFLLHFPADVSNVSDAPDVSGAAPAVSASSATGRFEAEREFASTVVPAVEFASSLAKEAESKVEEAPSLSAISAMTVKQLQEYAKCKAVKIPSSIRRKQDMCNYLVSTQRSLPSILIDKDLLGSP